MSSPALPEPRSARPWIAVLMVAVTFLLAANFHQTLSMRSRLNDDDLQFYYNALSFDHLATYLQASDSVSEHLKSMPLNQNCHCLWEKFRFDLRETFRDHYLLFHVAVNLSRKLWLGVLQAGGGDYAVTLGTIIVLTYYSFFAAVLLSLWFLIFGFVRLDLVIAFSIAVAAIMVLDHFSPYHPSFWELRVRPSGLLGWVDWWRSAVFMLISPGTSIVGSFPRSASMLLAMGVFLLRWSGRPGLAYASIAVIINIHQGSGDLLLFSLLAIDAVLFPRYFRKAGLLLGATIALSSLLLPHGLIGGHLGVSWWLLLVGILAIGLIVVFDAASERSKHPFFLMLHRQRAKFVTFGPVPADLIAIAALWVVWSAFSLAMYARIGQPDAIYSWGDLPARYLMLMRGPVFIGAAYLAVRSLTSRHIHATAALAAVACLFALWLAAPLSDLTNVARFSRSLTVIEGKLQAVRPGQAPAYDENLIYYAIVKSIETNTDVLTPLLRTQVH